MQWGGRGILKKQLRASPGVLAEGDGRNMENWPGKFWGLFLADALGKAGAAEGREEPVVCRGTAMFVPAVSTGGTFQRWRRGAHGRSRRRGALSLA